MKKIAIAAITSILALAACGGASSAPTAAPQTTSGATPTQGAATQTTAPATQPAASAPAATASATARKIAVTATNELYSLKTLEVKPGERIEFVLTNTGDEKHNMVAVGASISLVSPDFDAGQTVSWVWTAPTTPGTFKLQCSYHPAIPPVQVTVK